MTQAKDVSNQIFGRLTALEKVGKDRFGIALWKCLCVCGNFPVVRLRSLVSGATRSCGCYNREVRSHRMIENRYAATHELSSHSLYRTWATMRQRCNNPKNSKFYLYGGRGITVDPKWEDFAEFLKDMGERPEGMTLDRKDNTLGYSKENCRWATPSEQNSNRRKYKHDATGLFNEL